MPSPVLSQEESAVTRASVQGFGGGGVKKQGKHFLCIYLGCLVFTFFESNLFKSTEQNPFELIWMALRRLHLRTVFL